MDPLPELCIDEGPEEEVVEDEEDDEDEDFDPTLEDVQDEDDEEDDEEEDTCYNSNTKYMNEQTNKTSECSIDKDEDVSRRTRSKAKPSDLEQKKEEPLEFPDFSPDLYAPEDTDPVYVSFLNGLFADDLNDLYKEENDDESDPEFLLKTGDSVSRSGPKAITDKEIEQLESSVEYETPDITAWTSVITTEHTLQLRYQMTQHVQLLAQRYFLCNQHSSLLPFAEDAQFFLREISKLSHGIETSCFNSVNLKTALSLIDLNPMNKTKEDVIASGWRQPSLTQASKLVIYKNPIVFMFPELIPVSGGFYHPSKGSKVEFTMSEDFLIALGIQQFKPINKSNYLNLISQLLLPCKTPSQIKIHVKNVRKRSDEKNPIRMLLRGEELSIQQSASVLVENKEHGDISKLPEWLVSSIKPKPVVLSNNKKLAVSNSDNIIQMPMMIESKPWTREDDKEIVELIKLKLAADQEEVDDVFVDVAKSLKRDVDAVNERFGLLLKMLKQAS